MAVFTDFSGIVDEHDRVLLGGYPALFRKLLGLEASEWAVPASDAVTIPVLGERGRTRGGAGGARGGDWADGAGVGDRGLEFGDGSSAKARGLFGFRGESKRLRRSATF